MVLHKVQGPRTRDGRRVGEARRFRIDFDRCREDPERFAESLRDAFCDERRTRARVDHGKRSR